MYDYQYNIAAMIVLGCMMFSFSMKKTFVGKSARIFTAIMLFDFLAAAMDWVSCYTISYPQNYPLWLNYVVCLGYLLLYNDISVIYLLYIDSKTKIKWLKKPIYIYAGLLFAFYTIVILTSPWTHLVAYFDEAGTYLHGPVMDWLYAMPFVNFAIEIFMFHLARKRISPYQFISSMSLLVATGAAVIVSIINPRLLTGQLVIATTMYFVYLAFENPAYYTYKESQVLNEVALNMNLHYVKQPKNRIFLLLAITNFANIEGNSDIQVATKLNNAICAWLVSKFRKNVYCLEDGYFVIESDRTKITNAMKLLQEKFETPIVIDDDAQVRCEIFVGLVTDLDEEFTYTEKVKILRTKLKEQDDTRSSKDVLEYIVNKEKHEHQVINAMRNAIANDKFQVYYQPIYSFKTGKFESAEALIRLFDDEIGFVNPEEMIVLAEKHGFINKIGEIVFEKVCQFISEEKIRDLGVKYIEVNLSPVQFYRNDLVTRFATIMNRYGVTPEQINLEITETSNSENITNLEENVNRFREMGVSLSIDDFGTGFASIDYLIRYPVSIVKIDKQILWTAMKDDLAMIVLKNTIRMAKELEKKIVVEGVENEEMIDVLNAQECDYHQGFYYSKPIPAIDFVNYVKERNLAG